MSSTSENRLNELALSMHHNPGVYAVLLGAGISMAAKVPSAWEIVRDQIRKKAHLKGINPIPEGDALDQWYLDTYGTPPDYSTIIEEAEPTTHGQRSLLQRYFEPTEEDQEQDRKQPTAAHHAIARLVQEGFIRILITTNFDQLMEQALKAAGVSFFTVTSAEEIEATEPYAHGGVFLLKVHGDYLKANVRNSNSDLRSYPEPLRDLLRRIFNEFGLITCGWSGTWDHALRACIEHSPNRRYMLYWSADRQPSEVAQTLIHHQKGRLIDGMQADAFFTQLESKVLGLKHAMWTPPQTLALLAAEVKLCLSNLDRYRIRLQDLLELEAEKYNQERTRCALDHQYVTAEDIPRLIARIGQLSKRVQCIQATLLKYDHAGQVLDLWERSFLRRIHIEIQTPTSRFMDLSMMQFVLHFMKHAVQHEKWSYLERFKSWSYSRPNGGMATILEFMLRIPDLRDVLWKWTQITSRRPESFLVLTELTGPWDQAWTLQSRPEVFHFMLGEVVLNLMSMRQYRAFNPGVSLILDHMGKVGILPFHHWFREHLPQLRQLLGGDVQTLMGEYEQQCERARSSYGILIADGIYDGLQKVFEPT